METIIKRHIPKVPEKWNTSNGHSPLTNFSMQLTSLTEEAKEYIDKHTFVVHVKKGKHLLKSGELCNYVYLVVKGIIRGYISESGKEITTWISNEGDLVTSIRGFHQQMPTQENIQVIENAELVGFHFSDLQYVYAHFTEMNVVGRKLLEMYYSDAEERAYISRLPKASSKYERFIATRNMLANRVKLKYIASYLGITIETLSRIRNKIRY